MVRGDTNHDDIECKKCKWSVGTQTMRLCVFVPSWSKKHRGNTNQIN